MLQVLFLCSAAGSICLFCRGKSQSDLRRHMDTHNENEYRCHVDEDGCKKFSCKTYSALSKHYKEKHQVSEARCTCCVSRDTH